MEVLDSKHIRQQPSFVSLRQWGLLHRILSWIAGGLVVLWLVSGIVMLYVPYPSLSEKESVQWNPWGHDFQQPVGSWEWIDFDIWTVGKKYQKHRPFIKVSLADTGRTDLYWSLPSQRWVQKTTFSERIGNLFGAVPHWFYIAVLRNQELYWKGSVWFSSLIALGLIVTGTIWAIKIRKKITSSPRSWTRKTHSILGLGISIFLIAWLVSGFLSIPPMASLSASSMNLSDRALWADPLGENSPPYRIQEPSVSPVVRRERVLILGEWWYRELHRTGEVIWRDFNGNQNPEKIPALWVDLKLSGLKAKGYITEYFKIDGNDFWVEGIDPRMEKEESPKIRIQFRDRVEESWDVDLRSGEMTHRWNAMTQSYRIMFRLLHTWDFPLMLTWDLGRKTIMTIVLVLGCVVAAIGIGWGIRRLFYC